MRLRVLTEKAAVCLTAIKGEIMTELTAEPFTAAQQALLDVWLRHMSAEFAEHNVQAALDTMTEDAKVNHVPLVIGGVGKAAVGQFYAQYLLAQLPPDLESSLVSRTIGQDRIVEELVFRFTHSMIMEWILPGVQPTGKRIEIAVVGIIQFRAGKIAHERLYWDQASVLVQVGLVDERMLPVVGPQAARRLLDSDVPMNGLLRRTKH
ncbi:MAG TPA: nuclear transport factor 2 family protein [Polyangiales bacterium]|nr:nuclear transport factor 2 family protein [Polyangiales bacterium]